MTQPERLNALLRVLDLEEIDLNIFRGRNEEATRDRLFGGQVLAQALMAAGAHHRRAAAALAARLLPAHRRPRRRRCCTRWTAFATGARSPRAASSPFNTGAQFSTWRARFTKRSAVTNTKRNGPPAPAPDTLPRWRELLEAHRAQVPDFEARRARGEPPIDFRFAQLPTYLGGDPSPDPNLIWIRARAALPDTPLLHACLLTYATDMSLIDTVVRHHGRVSGEGGVAMAASLDHALWFHRPVPRGRVVVVHAEQPVRRRRPRLRARRVVHRRRRAGGVGGAGRFDSSANFEVSVRDYLNAPQMIFKCTPYDDGARSPSNARRNARS